MIVLNCFFLNSVSKIKIFSTMGFCGSSNYIISFLFAAQSSLFVFLIRSPSFLVVSTYLDMVTSVATSSKTMRLLILFSFKFVNLTVGVTIGKYFTNLRPNRYSHVINVTYRNKNKAIIK